MDRKNRDAMKIVMTDSLVGNNYSLCLCNALRRAGVDVELVTTEDRNIDMEVEFPVLHWLPSKTSSAGKLRKLTVFLGYLGRLFLHLCRDRVDAVHFQFFRRERIESLYFALLKLTGVRLIHTAHNVLPHERRKLDMFWKRIVYRSADAIIVHSEFIKDKLHRTFGTPRDKIFVIPHGNFDSYLRPAESGACDRPRSVLGLAEDEDVVLFFGYLREYKGVDLLVDAFDQAAKKNPRLRLVIAGSPGNGVLAENLRQKIESLPSAGRILMHARFIPSQRVADYFEAADLVALPYRQIDHSGIVHLAYSFGKPILGTRVGDFPETIEDGRSGFLVDPGDAQTLADAMSRAFAEKESLAAMREFIQELNRTTYSWDDIGRRTRELYRCF